MGTQAFISASVSGCPRPCEPQTELWTRLRNDLFCVEWDVKPYYTIPYRTVDPENWRTYSYCDTAEGTKQTAHLHYWFRV